MDAVRADHEVEPTRLSALELDLDAALALGEVCDRNRRRRTRRPLGSCRRGDELWRITSAFAVIFWVFAALVVLARGRDRVPLLSPSVSRIGTWVLVGLLPIGALMNFASTSEWERLVWGPTALLLAMLCFVVARDEGPSREE
jgi:hypothetical protein